MKRFLKVILILAAVFGAAGLGLTAGGAAMGATMGDVSVLDHGITQVLRVLDHEDSWEVEDSEEDMDELEDDFQAAAESAVTEKGVLVGSADSSAYTKVYEASAVSDLSCDLRYEKLVLKTWNEDKVQVKVTGRDHNRVKISNDNGSLRIASNQKVRNRSVEIFCPENLSFQKIKLQMGAGTIELDGHQVGVGGKQATAVLDVVGDGVAGPLVDVGELGRDGVDRSHVVDAIDLVDDGVEQGVLLAQDGGAGKVREGRGAGVGGVLLDQQAVVADEVRVGEVDGLLALVGGSHARDDAVDLAGVQGLDEAGPGQLDGNGLKAEGRGDLLGDKDVDSVGVGAVEALHRNGVIGGLGGLPVVRRVGNLHADAELAALTEGARSVGLGVGGAGVLGLGGRTACGEDRHAPDGQGRKAGKLEEVAARVGATLRRGGVLHGGSSQNWSVSPFTRRNRRGPIPLPLAT